MPESEQAFRTEPLCGFRLQADVLVDVTRLQLAPDATATVNPAERAAVAIMDALGAAGIDLCGGIHVAPLRRTVNPSTGEIRWTKQLPSSLT